jgi:hypothetical protein
MEGLECRVVNSVRVIVVVLLSQQRCVAMKKAEVQSAFPLTFRNLASHI